ncbi:MAG: hypothetical protein A3F42_00550 [Gammaproteobacteria bacterium RIFCSPHIGHO2_12_FULL_37_34]|nr:MAG: hypothetical protein A3F42_00550 [Gammaproteobacteria bacterium RIFCSPHIGHO2_12_FULL_37_34]
MTENLFRELEEKMMTVLAKLENVQKENHRLQHENGMLKNERESNVKRIHEFISLLDSIHVSEATLLNVNVATVKPVLVQG